MSELYCHKKNYPLRYSDFDFRDRLKPSSLLALLQESACLSADELGFGYDDLRPKNLAYLIVNSYVKFHKEIVLGDALEAETWPLPPRHVLCERDYIVRANGEVAVLAASRWCLVDFKSFTLRPPTVLKEAHANCPYRDEKCVEAIWKIPKIENGTEVLKRSVLPSECDHYFHANNTRYADYFFDCFTVDELSRPIDYFQIIYQKQAKIGTELSFLREDANGGSAIDAVSNGEVLARFFVRFKEKS